MKKFIILDKCNDCGVCTLGNDFFEEDAEGSVYVKPGVIIDSSLERVAQEVIKLCPLQAIRLEERKSVTGKDNPNINDYVEYLKNLRDSLEFKDIKEEEVKFDKSNVKLDVDLSYSEIDKAYSCDFKSSSEAKSYGKELIRKRLDEDRGLKPIIMKVLVDYKKEGLSQYDSVSEDSHYGKYVKQVKEALLDVYHEIILMYPDKLGSDWADFNVSDILGSKSPLDTFELKTGIVISEIKSSSYMTVGTYVGNLEVEQYEFYDGEGWFGRSKYKKRYGLKYVETMMKEFKTDLIDAFGFVDYEITELAVSHINGFGCGCVNKLKQVITDKMNALV